MHPRMLHKHTFQFISFCHVYHRDPTHSDRTNINDDCHLLHITRGQGEIVLDLEHRFDLVRGVVIAIPRGVPFSMSIGGGFEMLNIHYQLWLRDGRHIGDVLRLPYCFRPSYFDHCEERLRRLDSMSEDSIGESLRRSSLAYQIVIEHYASRDLICTTPSVADERIEKVANYLALNPTAYDMKTLEGLARLSRSQVNRTFRAAYGLSPHAFWEQHRLRKICMDIKRGGKTLAELAEEYGFSSPQYFSRWFRKQTSCSPSEFRNAAPDY
ncbi:MAG: AraC family transcriptional regulator [Candidatus Pacebacteria bacterium]|nr:AraC family transcriptional regulator [Candidatus Paceibacterota bacterium]